MKIIEEKFKGKTLKVYEIELNRLHVLRIVPSEMAEVTNSGLSVGSVPHTHAFEVYRPVAGHGGKPDRMLRSQCFYIPKGKMKEIQEGIDKAVREIEKGGKSG